MTLNLTALIAEDEIFIVLDVEEALEAAGVKVTVSFSSNVSALEWMAGNRPDFAVLDYRLKDGTAEPLADALVAHKVPFLVYSGSTFDPQVTGAVFHGKLWLNKPTDSEKLGRAVRSILQSSGS